MNIKKLVIAASLLAILIAGSVASVGALTPMHVGSFKVSSSSGQIKASVLVRDGLNRPVPGAAVQVSFEKDGLPTKLSSGMSGTFGWARTSATAPAGKWMVCVEEIHKIGFDFNPSSNICQSIQVP